jgi:hypothetical protein
MAKLEFLEPDEKLIDTWTILYKPHGGGMYNGKLHVTDKKLVYDAQFDMSVAGLIRESLTLKIGSYLYLAIPKNQIKNIEEKSSFFKKQIILTLDNDEKHTFDYGMLSIKKVAEAIRL